MPNAIVECVANYSEGRRPEVIEEILDSIAAVEGVYILNHQSDPDHNRSVVTFVGAPAAVEEAAFASIAKAAELIDMTEHRGEHPRIGATDVVPFVPVSGVTMEECVKMAERVGQRVGDELGIPVYLYEEAAKRPECRRLERIRRGEYETLRDVIATEPERRPDYGPKELGTAGATVIGAREFLIAYNVYLNTDDVSIAKKIARTVRHSSGGLRYVKALGLLVEGQAQVSMNLTNYHKTPISLVVETIRREAQRYGVSIKHSELIGLIPQEALADVAVWYTHMDQFEPDQILENKLYAALEGSDQPEQKAMDNGQFLDALADGSPAPGGGSASAYAGAMAAGLVAMVARLSVGKKKYAKIEESMKEIIAEADDLRAELTEAVQRDADAFDAILASFRRPKDDPERERIIQEAIHHAAEVPLSVAHKTVRVLELALEVGMRGNDNAITDAGTGAAMARAAMTGASYNVQINSLGLKDKTIAQNLLDDLTALEEKADKIHDQVKKQLADRGGLLLA
jgi:glutamate formiminotransferase/formiminotetrahydrofolate cyclodeaminase